MPGPEAPREPEGALAVVAERLLPLLRDGALEELDHPSERLRTRNGVEHVSVASIELRAEARAKDGRVELLQQRAVEVVVLPAQQRVADPLPRNAVGDSGMAKYLAFVLHVVIERPIDIRDPAACRGDEGEPVIVVGDPEPRWERKERREEFGAEQRARARHG